MTDRLARLTGMPNGFHTFVVDINSEEKTAAYVVVITTDSGKTFTTSLGAGAVFTLPPLVAGNVFTFVNTAPDGIAELTIDPNTTETITYIGDTTAGGTLFNTQLTSKYGDSVTLTSVSASTWSVTAARGIWAKGTA